MQQSSGNDKQSTSPFGFWGAFLILFIFWLLLSGHYDYFHISLGIICTALVSYISHDLLLSDIPEKKSLRVLWRFILYIPWLVYQIILANLHVAYLVLNPKMPIDPKIIHFKTDLKTNLSQVSLGNSITLTPGTITVDIREGEYYVHAVSKKVADDLLSGDMQDRIARIFAQGKYSTEK